MSTTQIDRQTYRDLVRHNNLYKTDRQIDDLQSHLQTERQMDRTTDTDRQMDLQRQTYRQTCIH